MPLNNDTIKSLLTIISPISGAVFEIISKDNSKSANIDDLDNSTKNSNEDYILNNLLKHTELLKELAIIRRIDTAEKVSIEEFYDTKGDGALGVQSTEGEFNIGLKGNGQKVTKRIYSFDGWREGSSMGIEKILESIKPDDLSNNDSKE